MSWNHVEFPRPSGMFDYGGAAPLRQFSGKIVRVKQKVLQKVFSGFWTQYYRMVLSWNPAVTQFKSVRFTSRVLWSIHPQGELRIGSGTTIHSGAGVNPVGGHRRTLIAVGAHGNLKIGKRVGISSSSIVCTHAVTIGDCVYLGGGVQIFDSDFHSIGFHHRIQKPDTHVQRAAVNIGHGAFIGAGAIILKGVSIGERSVVGAGSVVVKDVPAEEIWAGNPAKCIRALTFEEREPFDTGDTSEPPINRQPHEPAKSSGISDR